MDENPSEQTTPEPVPEEVVDSALPKTEISAEAETEILLEPAPSVEITPAPETPQVIQPEQVLPPPPEIVAPTVVIQPPATISDVPPISSPELTPVDPPPPPAGGQPSQPFDVSSLSDADLKAAAALYTRRNQTEFSRRGVAKRKETMELNQREIVDYLSLNNGSPLPRIAKHTNITPGTTSKYLRQLIASGKVRAEGWAKTRRYYLK